MVKNPLASAEDMGSIPDPGRSCVAEQVRPCVVTSTESVF